MKIRILIAPPLNPAYGLTVGSIHEARPNWLAGMEPAWFVDVKHGNAAFSVGIFSDEAEELQECEAGSAFISSEETHVV